MKANLLASELASGELDQSVKMISENKDTLDSMYEFAFNAGCIYIGRGEYEEADRNFKQSLEQAKKKAEQGEDPDDYKDIQKHYTEFIAQHKKYNEIKNKPSAPLPEVQNKPEDTTQNQEEEKIEKVTESAKSETPSATASVESISTVTTSSTEIVAASSPAAPKRKPRRKPGEKGIREQEKSDETKKKERSIEQNTIRQAKKREKRRKKKIAKMAKEIDPNAHLDPERWLPMTERSYYKHKRGKKSQLRGAQGSSSAVAQPTSSVSSSNAPKPTPVTSGPARPSKSKNQKKRKGK